MVITNGRSNTVGRAGAWLLAAACVSVASTQPAAAQGFFESLFGFRPHHVRPQSLPPQTSSYADPHELSGRDSRRYNGEHSGYAGRGTVYCVRTCDGRYFPMQRLAGASPAELCQSFCPSAQTMVFSGSKIDYAVAPNGTRYADLDHAFVYRDRVVENCTCNGKDGLGLTRLNTMTDPTLRSGDIVATNDGLVNFRGKTARTAEFTPINPSSGAWALRLSEIKVRPAPENDKVGVAPPADARAEIPVRKSSRRDQAVR